MKPVQIGAWWVLALALPASTVLASPPIVAQPAEQAPQAVALSPQARELARKVIIASGGDTSSITPSDATMTQALATLSKALPSARPEWRPVMEQAVRDEMRAYARRVFDGEVDIYARHLTQAQLSDILAFYATPAGKALAVEGAAIAHDRQAMMRQTGADLVPRMVAAVCAKEACPAPAAAGAGTKSAAGQAQPQ